MNESSGATASDDPLSAYALPKPLPLWLNNSYAKHIVKGNFMTLSARPKTVEQGEWIAHHGKLILYAVSRLFSLLTCYCLVVEHYRNLWNFVRVIHEKEDDGSTICNPSTCPKTSAGT